MLANVFPTKPLKINQTKLTKTSSPIWVIGCMAATSVKKYAHGTSMRHHTQRPIFYHQTNSWNWQPKKWPRWMKRIFGGFSTIQPWNGQSIKGWSATFGRLLIDNMTFLLQVMIYILQSHKFSLYFEPKYLLSCFVTWPLPLNKTIDLFKSKPRTHERT